MGQIKLDEWLQGRGCASVLSYMRKPFTSSWDLGKLSDSARFALVPGDRRNRLDHLEMGHG